jgi:hypothetical protein
LAGEEHLVEPDRGHGPDPGGVLDQRRAVRDHGVVHGVPVTAQLAGDLGHDAALSANLQRCPPTGPVGHRQPRRSDAAVLAGPRPDRTGQLGAAPAMLVPHQPGRPTEAAQIDQLDHGAVLHPRSRAALGADGPLHALFDMHTDRFTALVIDREDNHISHGDEERAHARSVGLHRGSEGSVGVATADSSGPCAAPGGPRLWAASSICPPAAN